MKATAKTIVACLTPSLSGDWPNAPATPWTISLAQANIMREKMVAIAPAKMNGFRFPQGTRQLSLRIPTYGWTSVPESGPAIQTKARADLLMPRDSKYGYMTISTQPEYTIIVCLQIHLKAQPPMPRLICRCSISNRYENADMLAHEPTLQS